MAAEQLDKTAKALGYHIKVETQGALGIEHPLSMEDIRNADAAIIAADIGIENAERFDAVTVVRVPVQDAIRDAKAVFAKIPLAR
jgi:PTS system fructose-specific IIB component/fructose-specific PTS system IIB-like component